MTDNKACFFGDSKDVEKEGQKGGRRKLGL